MDFYARGIQGFEQGRARTVRNRLGELSSAALSAPVEQRGQFASQIAALDPDAGFSFEQGIQRQQQAMQAESERKVGNMAKLLSVAPAEARGSLWSRIRPGLQQMGYEAPEAWDDSLLPVVQTLGGGQSQQASLTPSMQSLIWQRDNKVISDDEFRQAVRILNRQDAAAQNQRLSPQTFTTADGQTGVMMVPTIAGNVAGSQPPISPQGGSAMPGASLPTMFAANFPQARITSGIRGPERNAAVGGVPNSLHMTGGAVDVMPRDAEERAQMMQFAQANGFQVKTYPDGRLHIERDGVPQNRPNFGPPALGGFQRPSTPTGPDQAEMDRRANATLDMQTFGQPSNVIIAPGQATNQTRAEAAANQAGLVREQEDLARMGTERLGEIRGAARVASTEMASLNELERLLSQVNTGAFAETRINLGRAASFLGLSDGAEVSAAEAAASIANRLALSLRNPAGGEGMPGAMSDADRNFLVSTIPSIQNSPDGWRQMIEIRRRLATASQEQAEEAERFMREGGRSRDLPGHMAEWSRQRRLFADLESQGGAPAQARPRAQSADGRIVEWNGSAWVEVR
jgi:hypothetical protein